MLVSIVWFGLQLDRVFESEGEGVDPLIGFPN